MVAERPETSTFVHFSRKGQVRFYPLLLLEETVIGHESWERDRQGALSALSCIYADQEDRDDFQASKTVHFRRSHTVTGTSPAPITVGENHRRGLQKCRHRQAVLL